MERASSVRTREKTMVGAERGAWLAMLMIEVQQAQQAFRLIATRLSAAGQRPLPHTVAERRWRTGRENMQRRVVRLPGQRGAAVTAADVQPKDAAR